MMKKLLATILLLVAPVALLAQVAAKVDVKASLTPAELAIAQRIHLGRLPCALGAFVTVTADTKTPGYFEVQTRSQKFRMFPVETSTGALRLEDVRGGAVWLQLSNKSMLMNQRLGQRLADECMSPDQTVVATMMIQNPPPSLLDVPAVIANR